MKKFIAIIVAAIFVLIGIACMKNFGNGFFSFLMLAGVVVAVAWNVETNEGWNTANYLLSIHQKFNLFCSIVNNSWKWISL